MKTHWKKLINPNYIGAYYLPDGKDLTVTIEKVVREQITSDGGRKEECTVAYLKGHKPFILNVTNQKSISKVVGSPYIEDWAGKEITLFVTTTKMAGEVVECLRIRNFVAKTKKEKPTPEKYDAMLKALSGATDIESLTKLYNRTDAYDLTEDQIKEILKIVQLKENEFKNL